MLRLFCGYDPREAAAYHVFAQSVIERTTVPVALIPLAPGMLSGFDGQGDGTNGFILSRYLVPHLCNFTGWAIFCDGDMLCREDLASLWALKDERFAVQVVQHDYRTGHPHKYTGTPMMAENVDYPRKNWSSVVLWNCGHWANHGLTRAYVASATPQHLHRFGWLADELVGKLPAQWNHLVREYSMAPASIAHFTLGVPGFGEYRNDDYSGDWSAAYLRMIHLTGEDPADLTRRAMEDVSG